MDTFNKAKSALANFSKLTYLTDDVPAQLIFNHWCKQISRGYGYTPGDNIKVPISFFSDKLGSIRSKYRAFFRELLTIKHFNYIREGRYFIIYTDRKPLTHAFVFTLWQVRTSRNSLQFLTDIKYIKGDQNTVPDSLFRTDTHSITQVIISPDLLLCV